MLFISNSHFEIFLFYHLSGFSAPLPYLIMSPCILDWFLWWNTAALMYYSHSMFYFLLLWNFWQMDTQPRCCVQDAGLLGSAQCIGRWQGFDTWTDLNATSVQLLNVLLETSSNEWNWFSPLGRQLHLSITKGHQHFSFLNFIVYGQL